MIVWKEKETYAEAILRKVIAFVVVLAFMIPLLTPRVFADSSVSISGGDNVKTGDTFTVTVTYSGGNVGRVDGQLTYDTDRISYLSGGSSSGDSGYVQLKEAGTSGSIIFNLKFQAVSEGSVTLDVSTNEAYDLNEASINCPSDSKSLTIGAGSAVKTESTKATEEPAEETTRTGVDEKIKGFFEKDEETPQDNSWIPWVMIAVALLILIIVIITLLVSKKNRRKKVSGGAGRKSANAAAGDWEDDEAYDQSYGDRNDQADFRNGDYGSGGYDSKYATRMYDRKDLSYSSPRTEARPEREPREKRAEQDHSEMRRELQQYRERLRSQDDSGIDRKAETKTNLDSWDDWHGWDHDDDDFNKW